MNDFTFYSPTEFILGRGVENSVGDVLKRYGAQRVMILYGGGSAVRSGLVARVKESLNAVGIIFCELSGIHANPQQDKVYDGIKLAKDMNVDFLLPVGGGSVIDTAKSIACGVKYDGDFWDFYVGKAQIKAALPLGTVLTIPAAGSEGSGNAVITNTVTGQKLGIKAPMILRPKFSLMNPELTMTLPAWQTASGIVDMIVHILERYFSNTENVEVSDRLCEGVITAIINEGRKVMQNPDDYDARANIMWSGTIAHNGTCGVGREEDWAGHQLEHEVSAMYDVTHGAGLAVITPAYMTFMAKHHPQRMVQFAERVMGVKPDDFNSISNDKERDEAIALEGIRLLKAFFHDDLHMPITLQELLPKLSTKEINLAIPELTRRLHQNKGQQFGAFYPITPEVTEAIYKLCISNCANLIL